MIAYFDANAKYNKCQQFPLPVGNYRKVPGEQTNEQTIQEPLSLDPLGDTGALVNVDTYTPKSVQDQLDWAPIQGTHKRWRC